jgi:hypothetical protein
MFAILHAFGMLLVSFFKSRARLEAEILLLRHQLNVALRPHRRGSETQAQQALAPLLEKIGKTSDPKVLGALAGALRAAPAKLTEAQVHRLDSENRCG